MDVKKTEFPFTFKELTEEEKKIRGFLDTGLVRLSPTKYTTSTRIEKYGTELYNFKPRKDDIWLIGYPRSGTTLTQEILYLLGTDFNYEKAASEIMDERFPYLEDVLVRPNEIEESYQELLKKNKKAETPEEISCLPRFKKLELTNEKRFIKSHIGFAILHPELLDIGCKVIFIARNIKDCIVSEFYYPFHHEERMKNGIYKTWQMHKNHLSFWGDYPELLKDAWKRRHSKNLLILFYEEVNKDKRAAILKIADFLGKKITEQQLEKLLDHVDINKFKNNKSLNNDHLVKSGLYVKNEKSSFIRKGGNGGWRENFTKEMNDEINEWFLREIKEIPDFEIPQCWKEAMDL